MGRRAMNAHESRMGSRRVEEPISRAGTPTGRWPGVEEGDFFIEYWPGHPTYIYRAEKARGQLAPRLVKLAFSREQALTVGSIGATIGAVADDHGQHAGVIYEITNNGADVRQIGNVEVTRHGGKVTWTRSKNMRQTKMAFTRAPLDEDLKKRYEFFKTFGGGGRVGHAAEDSLSLARAERIAEEHGWEAFWQEDDVNTFDEEELKHISEILGCVLKDDRGNVLGSLWGISFGKKSTHREDDAYKRFVEAELALEAAYEKDLL